MNRVKEITDKKKAARLDKGAAARFVRNALYDSEEKELRKKSASKKASDNPPLKRSKQSWGQRHLFLFTQVNDADAHLVFNLLQRQLGETTQIRYKLWHMPFNRAFLLAAEISPTPIYLVVDLVWLDTAMSFRIFNNFGFGRDSVNQKMFSQCLCFTQIICFKPVFVFFLVNVCSLEMEIDTAFKERDCFTFALFPDLLYPPFRLCLQEVD